MQGSHQQNQPPAVVPASGHPTARGLLAVSGTALCVFAATFLIDRAVDENRLEAARDEARAGRYSQAVQTASPLRDGPTAGRAAMLRGHLLAILGEESASAAALQRAARLRPNDWVVHRDLAVILQRLGRRKSATASIRRALQLNPRLALPAGFELRRG